MSKNLKSLSARATDYIRKNSLISDRDHVLAAVSGGPDSVALLSILVDLKDTLSIERITVIHFDHRLRGDESDADREFVSSLAHLFGLDFRCGSVDVRSFARSRKISTEMAARDCRHSFFQEVSAALNTRKIALGHTADDRAEELMLRILRGTGPAGIQSMPPASVDGIIRPLLFATRDAILEYLRERAITFRNDSSNFDPFCQRNFLRLKVFPLLREAFHPQITETIARHADLAREEEAWWALQIQTLWRDVCLELSDDRASLDLERLRQLHPALVRRILRLALEKVRGNLSGIGMVHLEPLVEHIFSGKTGKSFRFPGKIEAFGRQATLIIRQIECEAATVAQPEVIPVTGPGDYRLGHYGFEVGACDCGYHHDPNVPEAGACDKVSFCEPVSSTDSILVDADKLKWPLELRFFRRGDRFHPLGMTGSKKLQDFFTDSKVPRDERARVPLLCDSEKICWVAGMRMDDRVKVEDHTRTVLRVKFFRLPHDGESK